MKNLLCSELQNGPVRILKELALLLVASAWIPWAVSADAEPSRSAVAQVVAGPLVSSESETIDEKEALEEEMARRLAEPPTVPLSPGAPVAEDAPGRVATAGSTRFNAMALAPTFVRVEQDAADWLYTDSWSNANLSSASGGTYASGSAVGSSAQLTFSGTWVNLGFIADRFSGRIEVTLDGVSQGTYDLYRREQSPVRLRFDGLANAGHTIELTILDKANPYSSNSLVQLDYADYGDGSLLPDGDFEEDDPRVLTSDGWTTIAYDEASGGSYVRTNSGTAWFPFAGDSFTLHALANSSSTSAQLFVDGVYLDTIDLFAPISPTNSVPRTFSFEGLGSGHHVLQIVPYRGQLAIDKLSTPGTGPFIDPDPPVAGVTRYEEDHPSIRYNGVPYDQTAQSWWRVANANAQRNSAGQHIYSAVENDWVSFDFEGDWVGVGLATDRRGGQAEIVIDGQVVEIIDLYSRYGDTASVYFDDLGAGAHTVTVTVLGTSHPESSGTRVYVDFFDVWDGQPLAEGTFEEDGERVVLSGGWGSTTNAEASGGAFARSTVNSTAWLPFTGDSLTFHAWTRADSQDVELRLNGQRLGLFDIYGYDAGPRNYSFDDLGSGPHVLEIRRYRAGVTLDAVTVPAVEPAFEPPAPAAIERFEEDHPDMRYDGQPYATMPQSWGLDGTAGWKSSGGFSVSTSKVGNTWRLSFEGQWLNIGLRSTVGEVDIVIDGVSQGLFDTSGGVHGVKNFVFDLDPGAHEVEVIVVEGAAAPDYMDVWQGDPVDPGWYDARLENEESGLFHFSYKDWWLRSEDIYANEGTYLRNFPSTFNNIWFKFVGTDLTVLGNQLDGTSLQVVIDGVDQGVFDMSSPDPFRGQPLSLHFPDLGEGAHVAQVYLPSAGLTTARIDAFEVNPDGFSSFLPEIEWYDTTAQESLPDTDSTGFLSTAAIGDLNNDGIVELVAPSANGRLYVYRGDGLDTGNGTPILWSTDLVGPAAEPALVDLTGDGNAEIIVTGREGTFAFRHDGQVLWSNPDVVSFNTSEEFGWGGASVGNLDLSPEPEIVISAAEDALYVLNHEGNIKWSTPISNRFPPPPVLADITGDGILDILMADQWDLRLFDYFNGGQLVWQYTQPDQIGQLGGAGAFGSPAVADITDDGQPEIIMNWGVFVEALDANGGLLWKYDTGRNNHFRPSPVTIADTTGDGELNIVTASARGGLIIQNHTLMVLDRFGSLVWEQAVGDNSASASGVAAQDLTGNGVWEVIWNGATDGFLLFDGSDGTRLFNEPYTGSGTVLDYPSLGDVDGDGEAEIVVAGRNGLFVVGHSGRWVDSRPVWNQHNYHINNIGNDWSVPFTEQNSWAVHNTYRTQTPERDPACATVDGEAVPPLILELSPQAGSFLPSNVPLVLSGRVIPVNAEQPLLDVQVNGQSVDTLDPSGSFFTTIELAPDTNPIEVIAMDRCGQAERVLDLNGAGDAADPWSDLADASVLVETGFSATTFDRTNNQLLVDVQAVNAGAPLPGPLLMAVSEPADPAVGLTNAEGVTPRGEPYVVVVPAGGMLAAGTSSAKRSLAFSNPEQKTIDFTPRWLAPVNQPPYFTSVPETIAVTGQTWTYSIDAADGNGDSISLALLTAPFGMSLDSGALAWTPAQVGNFEVTVEASDGRGATARQGFTLRVRDGSFNSPPVFTSVPGVQSPTGATYLYAAQASDVDGDTITFGLQAAPAGVQVDPASGEVSWAQTQPGQHSLVLVADDGRGGQASQAWTLHVGEPGSSVPGPAFSSVPTTFAAVGVQYRYGYRVAHFQDDAPTVSLTEGPTTMVHDAAAGVLTWVPGQVDIGSHAVELIAVDSSGQEATQRFDLQVLESLPNQPPYIISTPVLNARIGATYSYAAEAVDPEFEAMTWSLPTAPAGMSVDAVTGVVSWVPDASTPASVAVTVQASDPQGAVATQDFEIAVRAANSPPQITTTPPTSVTSGELYSARIFANDADGDTLTFTLLDGPPGMTLHPALGWLHWDTTARTPGIHPVELEVTDAWGGQDDRAFDLELLADNQPPEVDVNMLQDPACRGEPVTVCVAASDNVGLVSISLDIAGQARELTAINCHVWTPREAGVLPASAAAVDPSGQSAMVSVSLTVADCNDEQKPVVTLFSPQIDELLLDPTPLVVSIDDNTPEALTWTVSIRAGLDGEPEVLSEGSGPVDEAEVALIDPTRLAEGEYWISILGTDGVQTGGAEFRVNVGEGFKPGRVKFATSDTTLPLAGIPLTIGRSYDSLDAGRHGNSPGDLGPGWRLLMSGSVQDSAREAPNPDLPMAEFQAEAFSDQTRISVIKPNGERVGFTFAPKPKPFPSLFQFDVAFEPDPGVDDVLRAVDGPQAVFALGAGYADLIIPYNPSIYELETPERVVYVFSESEGLVEIRDALGGTLTITPDGIQSSRGPTIDYVRDAQDRITEILLPPAESGAERSRILYGYDAAGNLVSVTDLAGGISTFEYGNPDYPHHLTAQYDQRGVAVSQQVFDDDGRMIAQCPPDGDLGTLEGCTTLDHDLAAGMEILFDTRGFRSELDYDESGLLIARRDWIDASDWIERRWIRDEAGNVIEHVDRAGGRTLSTFDEQGNELTRTMPAGQVFTWTYGECRDQWLTATDPQDNTWQHEFDDTCRLRFRTDPLGGVTEYQFDASGMMTKIIDPMSQVWQFTYNGLGLLETRVDPLGATTTFQYDDLGRYRSITDRNGQERHYEYDDGGLLQSETWIGTGEALTFEYNDSGLVTQEASSDQTLEFEYWPTGRIKSIEHITQDGPDWSMEYAYDGNGNVLEVSDSAGGIVQYEYDGLDQLTSITQTGSGILDKRLEFDLNPTGLVTMIRRFGDLTGSIAGPTTTIEYQCESCPAEITRIDHRRPDDTPIHELVYTRNGNGHITQLVDAEGSHGFVYDGRGWLIDSSHPPVPGFDDGATVWDAMGNWLSLPGKPGPAELSYADGDGGHRLLDDGEMAYEFDARGALLTRTDLVSSETLELDHDPRGRLIGATLRDDQDTVLSQASYGFTPSGARTSVEVDGARRHLVHDGGNVVAALDGAGQVLWRRLHSRSIDRPLAEDDGSQVRWLLSDHNGTVRDVVDNDGQSLDHFAYTPFGRQVLGSAPTVDDAVRYTGREFDVPGGLGFYRARVYAPGIARFLSEDPLAPWHYRYAENNPLRYTDPTGESAALEFALELCSALDTVNTILGNAETGSKTGDFVRTVLTAASDGLAGKPVDADAIRELAIDFEGPGISYPLPCGLQLNAN